ncbi:MAG: PQQ-binding-like beta-propeller repeat protein [Chitinophagaceae bacterium]|nr:PQQ-binding-like beta-propeller repeat protein [Chitinophagaceae bacterium]
MTHKHDHLPTQLILAAIFVLAFAGCKTPAGEKYTDWKVYGGSSANIKYSALSQIDTGNVSKLAIAWVYRAEHGDSTRFGAIETNAIIIDSVLYGVSPKMKLFALDAATGKEKWVFDPADSLQNKKWHRSSVNMNRGVAYWQEGDDRRILFTVGPIAFAVDAGTGKLVPGFGEEGGVNLAKGLGRAEEKMSITPTSPVMVYKNLFIVSGLAGDETPGHIRAFDVKTGKQQWIFHTIPWPGEPGYETWEDTTAYKHMGSTNSWSGFSLDEDRGILFAGTGNPSNDFYGGQRRGDGLYGNCVLAINASTGKLIWHYQIVRHDVWDMDLPTPPILVTLNRNGKKIDAVAQTTKTGYTYVFDRENGQPLFPIEERPAPTLSPLPDEKLSPTQPFPVQPRPFARQSITVSDLNPFVPDTARIRKRFLATRYEGIYTPPTTEGTLIFPGYDGGGEWGGPSFDPVTQMLYVNGNEMAWILNIVENKPGTLSFNNKLEAGKSLYNLHCMGCHGPERFGSGDYPSLLGVEKRITPAAFNELLSTGRRMMPGFNHLGAEEKEAIASFILDIRPEQTKKYKGKVTVQPSNNKSSFGFTGYNKFLTDEGYPAISPPWGTLSAIDLNTGEYRWQIPFGEYEALKEKGIPTTGRENYGAPVVTAGGLLFVAATTDRKFRAINKRTGEILFETDLPASGVATPSVYAVHGRQFVVIACGGFKAGGQQGDAYVAFTIP